MQTLTRIAAATALAGAFALAVTAPSEARNGRNAAAIGGFVAGAAVGAAVAGSANRGYYGDGYYYAEPGYAYSPGYAYESDYYAYEPRRTYQPRYRYRSNSGCSTSGGMYGHRSDSSACY